MKTLAGRYKLGNVISEGNFGVVFEAVDCETIRTVVVRVINKKTIVENNLRSRFDAECTILKKMKHKNVVQMLEMWQTEIEVPIVMEYVSGTNLLDVMIAGELRQEQARFYFQQLMEGVGFLHKLGICHRNLELEKLLIDDMGNLKISGFDKAALDLKETMFTQCGTPYYTAPEQLRGGGYDGPKADIWSCGVILYTMLAGYFPFDGDDAARVIMKIVALNYTCPPTFSSDVVSLIQSILVASPENRASIADIMAHSWYSGLCEPVSVPRSEAVRIVATKYSIDVISQAYVSVLSAARIDTSEQLDKNGCTPVMNAVKRNQIIVAQGLIAAGANLDGKDKNDEPCLLMSTSCEMMLLLIESGANVNDHSAWGQTALMSAAGKGWVECVRLLLKKGADVTAVDSENRTALHHVAKNFELLVDNPQHMDETVGLLMAAGADIHCKSNRGETLLRQAVLGCRSSLVKQLIDLGVNLNPLDNKSKMPLSYALDRSLDIAKMLILAGAGMMIDGVSTMSPLFTNPCYSTLKELICSEAYLTLPLLQRDHCDLWFLLVQVHDLPNVPELVSRLVALYPELVLVTDAKGRVAVDIATPPIKFAINSVTLWFGKYRPVKGRPEHTSATCFVFKAMDESQDVHVPVALKLMRFKSQFLREAAMRRRSFDATYVMDHVAVYPSGSLTESDPDEVALNAEERSGVLTKASAERLYCVVMPLADRNLFVAMKQERFAGKEDLSEVVVLFTQLVKCVTHMHSQGVLHGDIKPLNVVRMGSKWMLIDLDASCVIGHDSVAAKSSSAYVPPEAVYVDISKGFAVVKSPEVCKQYNVDPLMAHGSFDVWSLGCVLYQLCSRDVLPLFAAGQDDNLNSELSDSRNSLWCLHDWTDKIKESKLLRIPDLRARNLVSQMLMKDPVKRPTLSRVLGHPFLSNDKSLGRMAGEPAAFDVFISYRVATDLVHAERLYALLTARGLRVWWDKRCLEAGKEWQQGFCQGLASSTAFLCILSKEGIEQPFSQLHSESFCDNVLLEHRLALELKTIDYIKFIFPLMVGERSAVGNGDLDGSLREQFRWSYSESKSTVQSVEDLLRTNMNELGLGTPYRVRPSVYDVANEIRASNGYFIGGQPENTYTAAVDGIAATLTRAEAASSKTVEGLRSLVKESKSEELVSIDVYLQLQAERDLLQQERDALKREVEELRKSREGM